MLCGEGIRMTFSIPLVRNLVLYFSVSLLIACGGGGGGDDGGGNGSITLSTSSVFFSAENNASIPQEQFISISYSVSDTTGVIVGWPNDASFNIPSWMSISPSDLTGNSSPLSLRLRVNTTSLSAGTYTTQVRVVTGDSNGILLDVKDINVTYTVTPSRVLSSSPSGVSFNQIEGIAVADQTLVLTDSTGTLPAWSSSIFYSSGSDWLTLTPSNDFSSINLAVTPLVAGTYNATISIAYTTTGGVLKTLSVPITYTATSISSTPVTPLVFSSIEGSATTQQTVGVAFSGGLTPTWSASVNYINGSGWLNLTANANSIDVQPSLLAVGTYQAEIVINYNTALGASSVSIPVSHTVTQGVSASVTSISVSAIEGQAPPAVPVSINYTGTGTLSWTTTITYNGVAGWLNLSSSSGASLPANTSVNFSPLSEGTYSATINVQYSFNGISGNILIPVTYTLSTAWQLPADVSFTLDSSTVAADLTQIIAIGDTGNQVNWTASSADPWLGLNPTTGNTVSSNQIALSLVNAEIEKLAAGDYSTVITFTADNANIKPASINVSLANTLPIVNFVAPYVTYTDSVGSDYVIVRGSGFTGLTQSVMFGTELATNVTIISDTEMRVTPPTTLAAGQYSVFVSNPLSLSLTQAELVVKAPTAFANQSLATTLGAGNQRMVYDAERETLFVSRCYFCAIGGGGNAATVVKYTYNSATSLWEYTLYSYPNLIDIGLTPDGKELLVVTTSQLIHVDPATMATNKVTNLAFNTAGTAYQMAILNNGMVIFRSAQATYNLIDGQFGTIELLGNVSINTSPDGSRAIGGNANNSSIIPMKYFDASTNSVVTTSTFRYFLNGSMSKHAERAFASGSLFDENLIFLGSVTGISSGALSPDGQLLYGYNFSTDVIEVIDISGLPPYSVTGSLSAEVGGSILVTNDAKTLFLSGTNYLLIRNTSTVVPVSSP